MDLIKEIPFGLLVPITGLLVSFVLFVSFESYSFFKHFKNKLEDEVDKMGKILERHSEMLKVSTEAIVELRLEIKRFNEFLLKIPKLESDIHYAHEKIRELKDG